MIQPYTGWTYQSWIEQELTPYFVESLEDALEKTSGGRKVKLDYSLELADAARRHSLEMARSRAVYPSPEQFRDWAHEIVVASKKTVCMHKHELRGIVNRIVSNPEHLSKLRNCRQIGVGIAIGPDDVIYLTQRIKMSA